MIRTEFIDVIVDACNVAIKLIEITNKGIEDATRVNSESDINEFKLRREEAISALKKLLRDISQEINQAQGD